MRRTSRAPDDAEPSRRRAWLRLRRAALGAGLTCLSALVVLGALSGPSRASTMFGARPPTQQFTLGVQAGYPELRGALAIRLLDVLTVVPRFGLHFGGEGHQAGDVLQGPVFGLSLGAEIRWHALQLDDIGLDITAFWRLGVHVTPAHPVAATTSTAGMQMLLPGGVLATYELDPLWTVHAGVELQSFIAFETPATWKLPIVFEGAIEYALPQVDGVSLHVAVEIGPSISVRTIRSPAGDVTYTWAGLWAGVFVGIEMSLDALFGVEPEPDVGPEPRDGGTKVAPPPTATHNAPAKAEDTKKKKPKKKRETKKT